jgi:hypothetical protein
MRSVPTVVLVFVMSIFASRAIAQGTQDYTGPLPRYQQSGPLPSNTTPPTPNRQSNVFSPGARTPRVRPIYRYRGTQRF